MYYPKPTGGREKGWEKGKGKGEGYIGQVFSVLEMDIQGVPLI